MAVGESALPSPCTSCICTDEGVSGVAVRTIVSKAESRKGYHNVPVCFALKISLSLISSCLFQAQCASLRITDCVQLMREASRDSILRDDVCMAQCGFLLDPANGPGPGPASGPSAAQQIEFTTAPTRSPIQQRPGSRQLPPELLAPPPFRRGPSGPPPRVSAARRNPRVLRPGPPPSPSFQGIRIPDFSSIIG